MATSIRYEIQIEVNNTYYILDTYDYSPVSLQYQISDITEVDKRKANFSKSIKLPLTGLNRQIFGDLFNLANDATYDPNRKAKCWIMVNTVPVFIGNLQVTNATIDDIMNKTEVEVVVYSENDDFFKDVGEKYVNELNLSELDHQYSIDNIRNSWNATASSENTGYFYPMIDYGFDWNSQKLKAGLSFSNFYPALYIKRIWDKIFNDTNYTYQSNFLNSTKFKNLIMPFSKGELRQTLDPDTSKFRVGMSQSNLVNAQVILGSAWLASQQGNQPQWREAKLELNNETSPNGDPYGWWNTTTYEYTNNSVGLVNQRFGLNLDIWINLAGPPSPNSFVAYSSTNPNYVYVKRSRDPRTGATVSNGFPVPINGQCIGTFSIPGLSVLYEYEIPCVLDSTSGFNVTINQVQYTPSNPAPAGYNNGYYNKINAKIYTDNLDGSDVFHTPIQPGEKVWVVVGHGRNFIPANNFPLSYTQPTTFFFNEVNDQAPLVQQNQIINATALLPDNLKQKDFLTSIIKMFNLYIEPSKDWDKTLIIEPRDDYYASGVIEDWTNKIDLNTPIEEVILSNTQYKTIYAHYKEDKDYLNDDYNQITDEIYGQYKEEIENDFISDEYEVSINFAPTPISNVPNMTEFVIPRIGKLENNLFKPTAVLPRILTKYSSGLLPTTIPQDFWKFYGTTYSSYPYAGHFDNPFDPTYDLNFGQIRGLYYNDTDITNNNLIQSYWRKQFDEVNDKNAKLITCEMYLNPTDIYNFRFNKKIFLDIEGNGQYWRVQSITNYDPGNTKTCTVELLKIKDITVPIKKRIIRKLQGKEWALSAVTSGQLNKILSPEVGVFGNNNSILNDRHHVVGNGNVSVGSEITFRGNFNRTAVNTRSVDVFGDNNLINDGSERIFIVGGGNVVTGGVDDVVILGGNNLYVDTPGVFMVGSALISGFTLIDAGADIVLNPFNQVSTTNLFDGSENVVKQIGGNQNIDLVNAGADAILYPYFIAP